MLVIALCIEVLLCWVHKCIELCLLLGLISWSLYNVPSLFHIIFFFLKSVLSEMRIATSTSFWFPCSWNMFFHPFNFGLYVSLNLKWVSCRQHIYGSCFCIHSASLCPFVGAFHPFTFKVIIDKYYPIAIYFVVLGLSLYFFLSPFTHDNLNSKSEFLV